MAPELVYFIKINIGLALFYAFYRLFFYRDTFFQWRRYALLSFLIISLFYPLLNIQDWIKEQEPMNKIVTIYATSIMAAVTVVPQESSVWDQITDNIGQILYWMVAGLLCIRFLIQLTCISFLAYRCRKTKIDGIVVRVPRKTSAPFSFFRWIFISPELHTERETKEILIHEQTHSRQLHSIDVVLAELMTIFCWMNPFAWLLKREIRNNLEYMADNHVILSGHDTKSYQFHLLGLANQKAAANLYNNFNVLPLKNRITMMNRKRTKSIGRTKYIMFIPLAALLMLISNIEAVARVAGKVTEKFQSDLKNINPDDNSFAQLIKPTDLLNPDDGDPKVYTLVDIMPQFPGGVSAQMKFLASHIKYPVKALENKESGRVVVKCIITEKGQIKDVRIIRGKSPSLDAEAIRVIQSMPNWIPGKLKGKNVSVYYTIPVVFKLDGSAQTNEKPGKNDIVVVGYAPTKSIDQMPQFPGGESELMKCFFNKIKYPTKAQENKEEGKVVVSFTITEKGKVSDAKVVHGASSLLDAEAIRVVGLLPDWIPGKQNGKDVSATYTIPVIFKLSGSPLKIDNAEKNALVVVGYGGGYKN